MAARPCDCCATDRNLFDPACLRCGQRYMRAIKRLPWPIEERQEWLRKVLATWMKHGHAEESLRAPMAEATP